MKHQGPFPERCIECVAPMPGIMSPMLRDTCFECGGKPKTNFCIDDQGRCIPLEHVAEKDVAVGS